MMRHERTTSFPVISIVGHHQSSNTIFIISMTIQKLTQIFPSFLWSTIHKFRHTCHQHIQFSRLTHTASFPVFPMVWQYSAKQIHAFCTREFIIFSGVVAKLYPSRGGYKSRNMINQVNSKTEANTLR